ncbi:MAG: hypothetical protein IPJ69_06980 [Deltaproteobacteria bacterium]|nr:MAG: hypothetical protein IPJ69_06980 [Deltaproteobacteria bacterium]
MSESIMLKDVFAISDREVAGEPGKNRWTRVGVGFVNRDSSINIVLDAIPVNGRLQIRDRQKRETINPAIKSQRPFTPKKEKTYQTYER